MRRDVGGRIPGKSYDDLTREGGGETASMEHTGQGSGPQSYWMSFPAKVGPRKSPLAGCPGRVATRTAMRVHFVHRHVLDTVLILEEVKFPHPQCVRCDMLVPRQALNRQHLGTAQCKKWAKRKRRRLAEAETRENAERAFDAYR